MNYVLKVTDTVKCAYSNNGINRELLIEGGKLNLRNWSAFFFWSENILTDIIFWFTSFLGYEDVSKI